MKVLKEDQPTDASRLGPLCIVVDLQDAEPRRDGRDRPRAGIGPELPDTAGLTFGLTFGLTCRNHWLNTSLTPVHPITVRTPSRSGAVPVSCNDSDGVLEINRRRGRRRSWEDQWRE